MIVSMRSAISNVCAPGSSERLWRLSLLSGCGDLLSYRQDGRSRSLPPWLRSDADVCLPRRDSVTAQDFQCDSIRATVLRPSQRTDRAGDRGIDVGARTGYHPAAKVDALNSCSAYRIREVCIARTQPMSGACHGGDAGNVRRRSRPRFRHRCASHYATNDTNKAALSRGSR